MSGKILPAMVRLKKVWVVIALIFGLSLALVILYNLFHAAKGAKANPTLQGKSIHNFADTSEIHWYHGLRLNQHTCVTGASSVETTPTTVLATVEPPAAVTDPNRLKVKEEAMRAPISSNQLVEASSTSTQSNTATKPALNNPPSPYVIQAGTLIPGILITGIYSDLPGQMIGQVRANVYDSVEGCYLLIPQGSKLIGRYDAKILYGQERVFVAWQRLILPNGQSMDLSDMAGVDTSGYAGFSDRVNAHYSKLLGASLLTSVFGAGVQLSQPPTAATDLAENTMRQAVSQNVAASSLSLASELTSKNLNVQPTLEIRPGYMFNVSVTKDLVFPEAYQPLGACD